MNGRRLSAVVIVLAVPLGVVLVSQVGLVDVAAASAPDCSTVDYTGDGTSDNPWQVGNVDQLQCINEDHGDAADRSDALNGDYVLTSDIDASETENWHDGKGFDPIGDCPSSYSHWYEHCGDEEGSAEAFTGTFDGNSYVISNLTIDRPDGTGVGLFALADDAVFENIRMKNATVKGDENVGGLVGDFAATDPSSTSAGIVENVSIDGQIDGGIVSEGQDPDGSKVGGIVGLGSDIRLDNENVFTGNVTGGLNVGGIVGRMAHNTRVQYSYARANVTATSDRCTEGSTCSTNGGDRDAGGIAGNSGNQSPFAEVYAAGEINGKNVGGIVGDSNQADDFTDAYWDKDRGPSAGTGGDINAETNLTGLTTDQMTGLDADANFGGFDFENRWQTVADDYPVFQWEADAAGEGTVSGIDALDVTETEGVEGEITVVATDEYGNPIEGETITVEANDAGLSGINVSDTSTTDANGEATFAFQEETVNTYTVEFSAEGGSLADSATVTIQENFELTTSDGDESTGLSEAVVVDDSISLSGPDETLDAARVTIQNNKDGDVLSANTSGTSITATYDAATGILELSGSASVADYEQVLRTVEFENTNADGETDTTEREITVSLGDSLPSEETGHYYEFVEDEDIRWDDARDAAEDREYFGLSGYLVTVTSQAENDFVAGKLEGQGWMGAEREDDDDLEDWRWVTGPEGQEDGGEGRHFFDQTGGIGGGCDDGGGTAIDENYENWNSGEPNDCNGEENYGHFLTDPAGAWNDYAIDNDNIEGYIVEYGGLENDPDVQLRDTKNVTFETSEVTGTLRDALDDGPIEDDGIVVTAEPTESGYDTITAETDSNGEFSLMLDNGTSYTLSATATVDEGFTITNETGIDPTETTEQDLRLGPDYDGSGTNADPFRIHDVEDLQQIRYNLSATYELQNDVDASGTSSWFGGDGFDPIGDYSDRFTGTFDGDGHTIAELTIDRDSSFVGLFGYVDGDGTVEEVGVEDVDITGDNDVGGLVGYNRGNVTESFATGNVTGGEYVGGLAGNNFGDVTKSYATGNVDADDNVGGLVGQNTADVTESYATGDVEGDNNVGGLVGYNSDTVTDSYWDAETTNQDSSAGSPDANGLSTDEMQRLAPYANMDGFSFRSDETWLTVDGYPALAWQDVTELTLDSIDVDDLSAAAGENDEITVTAEASDGDPAEEVEIAVIDADGLEDLDGASETTDDGEATFPFNEENDDDYEVEFEWAADSSVADTATVTVEDVNDEPPTDPDEGSSNGKDPVATEPPSNGSVRIDVVENTTTVDITDLKETREVVIEDIAVTNGQTTAGGDDRTAGTSGPKNVTMERLSVTVENVAQGHLNVTARELPRETPVRSTSDLAEERRAFTTETGTVPIGEVVVEHTLPDDRVSNATFEFSVHKDYLAFSNVSTDEVGLFRNASADWEKLPTTVAGENDTHYHFEAESPGFSRFFVGTTRPVFDVREVALVRDAIALGESATVTVTVENVGGVAGSYETSLLVGGEVHETRVTTIPARSNGSIAFDVSPSAPGDYELAVGGRTLTLTVEDASTTAPPGSDVTTDDGPTDVTDPGDGGTEGLPWRAIVALTAGVVLLVVLLLWRRRDDEEDESPAR